MFAIVQAFDSSSELTHALWVSAVHAIGRSALRFERKYAEPVHLHENPAIHQSSADTSLPHLSSKKQGEVQSLDWFDLRVTL